MKNLFKNMIMGAASIRLDIFSFLAPSSLENFEIKNQIIRKKIEELAYLRNISQEQALKKYFQEHQWGQFICFFLAMGILLSIMGLSAFTHCSDLVYTLLVISLYGVLFIPQILAFYWEKK